MCTLILTSKNKNIVAIVQLIHQQYNFPIIYLTANTDDRSFEFAKTMKPFAFIEKPFRPKRLVRTVELLIEQLAEKARQERKWNSLIYLER